MTNNRIIVIILLYEQILEVTRNIPAKLVFGFGVNDSDTVTQIEETVESISGKRKRRIVWRCPYYRTWTNMLKRCYSPDCQKSQPTYSGCFVSLKWKEFSKFKKWMETQDWEGKSLDKDILFEGNKIYGPETCVFVDRQTNNFIEDSRAARGEWPIGVYFHKDSRKFKAQCKNSFTKKMEHLGYFTDPAEAHLAWKKRKHELAVQLSEMQTDERVREALIKRYAMNEVVV